MTVPLPRTVVEPRAGFDTESHDWVRELSGAGREHDEAVTRLHALVLHAARFEVARRRSVVGGSRDADELAMRAAGDALAAILSKLHTYRGDTRFTTWACKFAVLEAAVKIRRHAWAGREVPPEATGLARLAIDAQAAIVDVLSLHERDALVAVTLNDVPIDVLAERWGTTRQAVYKTVQDARRKLREYSNRP